MNKYAVAIVLALILAVGVTIWLRRPEPSQQSASTNSSELRYVALGDSYTIGEGVNQADRWPNQLANMLTDKNIPTKVVANPSRTGFTTQDLLDKELKALQSGPVDFITLQIGVNDFYQGLSRQTFESNLQIILDEIQRLQPQAKLLLVTIPDYGLTPFGQQSGRADSIAMGIQEFNTVIIMQGSQRSVPVADIFAVSQQSTSAGNVAPDGLHPSAAQYKDWLMIIEPAASQLLQ